ncbi:MAG: hypothetical protein KA059_06815 [Elusimicrobiales bacterium]|nr:hypothetical protein [Elusimicrobiales bacterium]
MKIILIMFFQLFNINVYSATQTSTSTVRSLSLTDISTSSIESEVVIKSKELEDFTIYKEPFRFDIGISTKTDISIDKYELPFFDIISGEKLVMDEWSPELLYSNRIVNPLRIAFSPDSNINFYPSVCFGKIFTDKTLGDKLVREWNLVISDELGDEFKTLKGNIANSVIKWDGSGKNGWILPGHTYSPLFTYIDSDNLSHSCLLPVINLKGFVYTDKNVHIELDYRTLFNTDKYKETHLDLNKGIDLLIYACDIIREKYPDMSARINIFTSSDDLSQDDIDNIKQIVSDNILISVDKINLNIEKVDKTMELVDIVLE